MSDLPKPTVIELSKWELEYYTIKQPTMTKIEYLKKRCADWYKYQYRLRNSP
jgi:hypothetical protein